MVAEVILNQNTLCAPHVLGCNVVAKQGGFPVSCFCKEIEAATDVPDSCEEKIISKQPPCEKKAKPAKDDTLKNTVFVSTTASCAATGAAIGTCVGGPVGFGVGGIIGTMVGALASCAVTKFWDL